MIGRHLIGLVVFVALVAGASAGRGRVLQGRVLNVDGTPSSGTLVLPIGLDRGGFIMEEEALRQPLWQYRTDRDGRFTVRFGEFFNDDSPNTATLGWSYYHFVALPGKSDGGAISDMIGNPRQKWYQTGDEWGPVHYTGDKPLDVTMQRMRGVVVEGYVFDLAGNELAGTTVSLSHDLHSGSHTGGGGEIFRREAVTDAHGRYRFEHVYPVAFTLQAPYMPGKAQSMVWLQTRLGEHERWQDERIDKIKIKAGQGRLRVDIGLVPRGQFVYRGTVTDESGRPIEDVDITLAISLHNRVGLDFQDSHSFTSVKTGADGTYEIRSDTKWIRFIRAGKKSYESKTFTDEREEGGREGVHINPGVYDFKLKAVAK
ncbi:hypothetical protein LLG95_16620 [bacterium]|nr:hypothetical protein [bacterium]